MLLVLNILLIIFIIGMVYMWAVQGFFSALIHLSVTIVAGTLAFAMWEPVSGLLMAWKPAIAMSVGLLVPFGVLLLVLRMVMDKLIKKNMQFQQMISGIGGGACGLVSGVLTAGILVMGLGLLPTGYTTLGYQAWTATSGGKVVEDDAKLWVGVDEYAYNVFSFLSRGSFAPTLNRGVNLSTARPELPKMIVINRQSADERASLVARPQEVRVGKVYERPADNTGLSTAVELAIGESLNATGHRLVVVDTKWTQERSGGAYDGDDTFRVSASQVRLITSKGLYGPKAFSKAQGDQRIMTKFARRTDQAWGSDAEDTIAWVFVVPTNEAVKFMQVRNLRFELPKQNAWEEDVDVVAEAVGVLSEADAKAAADAAAEESSNEVGDREGTRSNASGNWVEVTNKLPRSVSKNFARNLSVQGSAITSGYAEVDQKGSVSSRTKIDTFYVPSHQAMIRIEMTPDRANSFFGQAMASASALGMVGVKDDKGSTMPAVGFVLQRGSHVTIAAKRIRSAKELPVNQMEEGDKLYVYFKVNRDRTIKELIVGGSSQDMNVVIPASGK
ncbi:Colicin V production protein [Poriferisphaera corsica]|uniref:Colicin V production protein n=1 Tax=Poriferisphaera corsica TaxID=2528020 RepID=A0A517YXI1_9BACT|nr:CvpA family protein [Poriferisphaera corsica]QDU34923.1 Colicin V production protein [Poriferisphaera corsica]